MRHWQTQMAHSGEHGHSPTEALIHFQIALQSRQIFSYEQEVGCRQRPCLPWAPMSVISTHVMA